MKALLMLMKRHIKVYRNDRGGVFFSMLSMFIILILNVVFLGESNIEDLKRAMNISSAEAELFIAVWLFAGIIVVNSLTTSVAICGIMTEDEDRKRMPSLLASPVKRFNIALSYILSAFVVSVIISILTFLILEAYLFVKDNNLFSLLQIMKVVGVICVNSFASSAFAFLIVSFVHSIRQFSGINILIGTLVGFVTGIYVVIGELPDVIQKLLKFVPILHGASLMREVCLENVMNIVFKNQSPSVLLEYTNRMGITLSYNGSQVPDILKIIILLFFGIVCILVSGMMIKKRQAFDR